MQQAQNTAHIAPATSANKSITERLKATAPPGGGAAVGGAVGAPGGVLAGGSQEDHQHNPSAEGGVDPAPTRHDDGSGSKYEAKEPFRSRKGDRFS